MIILKLMRESEFNMKVLVISHMYPSSFNQMSGIFVHQQVKALVNQGIEIKVVCPVPFSFFPLNIMNRKWKAYSQIPYSDEVDGIEVFYPRYIEFPRGLLMEYSGYSMYRGINKAIDKIYQKFNFDIIHAHVALPDGFASMLISKKYNKPNIVTIHGQDLQYTIFKNRGCKKKLYRVFNSIDKIITVSSKLKKIVKNEKFYSKISVINNGVDLSVFNESKKGDLRKDNKFLIISASNLIESKGIDLNIKALSRIIKKYPNIMYYIIGEGEERIKLENLVNDLRLDNNVRFLGKLSHIEVIKYMNECDLYSMPSWQEGFGMVYIEAMACAKPVIAVYGEGIQDAIDNGVNGILVKPKDIESLADAIELIIQNPNKAKIIGENAKRTVTRNLTWEINAKRTIEVYKSL